MASGLISDFNSASASAGASVAGGRWSPPLPASNLLTQRYLAQPARQLEPTAPDAAQFIVTLPAPLYAVVFGLLFHTLTGAATRRVTCFGPGGGVVYVADWAPVIVDAPFSPDPYAHHAWIQLAPTAPVSAVRVELLDPGQAWYDVGGLWIGEGWSPRLNFDYGRELGVVSRDQVDETPSGRLIADRRTPRRELTVSWTRLSEIEAYRLYDGGVRARATGGVVLQPDPGDRASMTREAWPAVYSTAPKVRLGYDGQHTVTATLREIIA